ncbi:hypothetical protein QAD02_018841 [Eretmocerus hayati]|uniref:Uncharacterized protein n=1 Tax=Eretmocerus hayati TaxID=131215 RepID=A0ACC2PHH6_9HYME|nr:hypothetical protein QAD02_018841 [Eretmocerus hayati]
METIVYIFDADEWGLLEKKFDIMSDYFADQNKNIDVPQTFEKGNYDLSLTTAYTAKSVVLSRAQPKMNNDDGPPSKKDRKDVPVLGMQFVTFDNLRRTRPLIMAELQRLNRIVRVVNDIRDNIHHNTRDELFHNNFESPDSLSMTRRFFDRKREEIKKKVLETCE